MVENEGRRARPEADYDDAGEVMTNRPVEPVAPRGDSLAGEVPYGTVAEPGRMCRSLKREALCALGYGGAAG